VSAHKSIDSLRGANFRASGWRHAAAMCL